MKSKTTQKAIKSNYNSIIRVGYDNLQHLLLFENPIAYTTRVEGWACDIYDVDGVAISTGYTPFGNIRPSYSLCREYDEKARAIVNSWDIPHDEKKAQITSLLHEFREKVLTA